MRASSALTVELVTPQELYPAATPRGGSTVAAGTHPDAVTAVNARIAATTTFVTRRDMATPFIRPPGQTLEGSGIYFNYY
ncbi:hypothetical protein GCM10023161_10650 [Mycobacterium paraffinicum]|uniref:Uncharacterized protein n=1 Tax=Mycobacterium paraffinicum TaxID=53378 RepID=A0ABP8RDA0_9MYCO